MLKPSSSRDPEKKKDSRELKKKSNSFMIQLGTMGRAKRKVDEMQKVIAEARRAAH